MINSRFTNINTRHKQKGFNLLEVLIALLVLSIGLLGLASLQANGLRNNNSAYMRSQANLLVNDILDRIRANRAGLTAGEYDDPFAGGIPTDPGCISVSCTPAQLADYDVLLWQSQIANILPSGAGAISGNGADSIFTITIRWDDSRTGATGLNCGSDPTVDLTCFTVNSRI